MRMTADTFPVLAMNAPYITSQPHAIPLGGLLAQTDNAYVSLFVSLMPALLPRGDEFQMNSWRTFLETTPRQLRETMEYEALIDEEPPTITTE